MRDFVQVLGRVEDGKLVGVDRAFLAQAMGRWEGRQVYVRIGPEKETRSARANAFLWAAIYAPLAAYTTHTEDEIHEVCKGMFLPKSVAFANGNGDVVGNFVIGGSTTVLTPDEFSDYIRRIKEWALEKLNFEIPDDGSSW